MRRSNKQASPSSSSSRQAGTHTTPQEQTAVGQSRSCEEPPVTLMVADTSYLFVELDTADEPVMNLGYVACEQGRFTTGDGGPGTLIINGTAPSVNKRKAVIFTGAWGRALYESSNG